VAVVLDVTPFYAESGGQAADAGRLTGPDGTAEVIDVQRPIKGLVVHQVRVTGGQLTVGARLTAQVDARWRLGARQAHSGTHVLHAALRQVLGPTALQSGSYNRPGYLRLDFAWTGSLSPATRSEIEDVANQALRDDLPVTARIMPLARAREIGALALFGETYDEQVRVVEIGGAWSRELCGGTHVSRSSQIGVLALTGESSVGAGHRRVEAVVGLDGMRYLARERDLVTQLAAQLQSSREDLPARITALLDRARAAERRADQLARELAAQRARRLAADAVRVNGRRADPRRAARERTRRGGGRRARRPRHPPGRRHHGGDAGHARRRTPGEDRPRRTRGRHGAPGAGRCPGPYPRGGSRDRRRGRSRGLISRSSAIEPAAARGYAGGSVRGTAPARPRPARSGPVRRRPRVAVSRRDRTSCASWSCRRSVRAPPRRQGQAAPKQVVATVPESPAVPVRAARTASPPPEILPNLRLLTRAFRTVDRPIVYVVRLYEPGGGNADRVRRTLLAGGARIVAPVRRAGNWSGVWHRRPPAAEPRPAPRRSGVGPGPAEDASSSHGGPPSTGHRWRRCRTTGESTPSRWLQPAALPAGNGRRRMVGRRGE